MIKMALPIIIKRREDGLVEIVAELACDDTGQLWGMVAVHNASAVRLYYDRWIRWNSMPFSENEVVEKSSESSSRVVIRET